MSDNFRFKQFTVWHDKCAMKVGTDGVLVGAWCDLSGLSEQHDGDKKVKILDVGCGSGLIGLMIAQRINEYGFSPYSIDAIDIDENAVDQANYNFSISPFKDRMNALHYDFKDFANLCEGAEYDLIISNPPFFQADVLSPDIRRHNARHTSSMSFGMLIRCSKKMLKPGGQLCVIIPYTETTGFIADAGMEGLMLMRRCDVKNSSRKQVKRTMLQFVKKGAALQSPTPTTLHTELCIRTEGNEYSDDYKFLTGDFYLNM